jgi:hypothetical protein
VSLGKTNYCINALLEKGLTKDQNFKSNKRKLATPTYRLELALQKKQFLLNSF